VRVEQLEFTSSGWRGEDLSKPRIRSEGKAQAYEKTEHLYVSILKRLATQLPGLGRGFEMASKKDCGQT